MIKIIPVQNQSELQEALAVRQKVFVEEQRVPADLEYDAHENTARHYLARHGAEACGAARWRATDQGVKLERFAVLPAFRNHGVGGALLHRILEDVRASHPKKKIYLHAQIGALAFYLRHGFVTEGEKFSEAGIEHYKMYLPKEKFN